MPRFSRSSKERLLSCHSNLQDICNQAIKTFDFTVLCGHRNETDQNIAFESGASKLKWPDSKHNKIPSEAFDLAPYPIDWNNHIRFKELADHIKAIAKELDIDIEAGIDWKKFPDLVHYQLV